MKLTKMIKYLALLFTLIGIITANTETQVRAKCPNGQSIFQSDSPSSNGCGVEPFILSGNILDVYDFNDCCDQHDDCYSSCTTPKLKCDQQFYSCLQGVCYNDDDFGCDAAACSYYTTVLNLGNSYYRNAVEDHCECNGGGDVQFVETDDVQVQDCNDNNGGGNNSSASTMSAAAILFILSILIIVG